ncbi:MAG: SBBP repeat-containing protein, partial [Chitinophagales bacterium]
MILIRSASVAQPAIVKQFALPSCGFIENAGQVKDQKGTINSEVRYLFAGDHFNLALKASGFSMQIFQLDKTKTNQSEDDPDGEDDENDFKNDQDEVVTIDRVDVSFIGANHHSEIVATNPTDGYMNFFGASNAKRIHSFRKITYKNIYPHTDLNFYSDEQKGLRFEFVLHPGADPKDIVLQQRGMSSCKLNDQGNVIMNTSLGWINFSGLHTFSENSDRTIPSAFCVKGNKVSFQFSASENETIVIDPNIIWGTYFGGEKSESSSFDLVHDSKSNVLITGATKSATYISTSGAYQTSYRGGGGDAYLSEFSSSGQMKWSTYFGGYQNEITYAIAVDSHDDIYIVGSSTSNGITTTGVYQQNQAGQGDIFIAKFDTTGFLMWCTLMGGPAVEQARAVACDVHDFVYIAGYTESAEGIASSNGRDTSYNGNGDAFLSKFTSTGQRVWSTYIGGTGQDRAHSLEYDNGFIYVLGTCESDTGFATVNAHQISRGGNEDAFLAKFDTLGNRIWSTYYGGTETDHGRCVKIDGAHNIYITGFTASDTGIGTAGTFEPNWFAAYSQDDGSPYTDGYVAKFTPEGKRIWGSYYGGENN